MCDLAFEPGDGALPKPVSGAIRRHDANLPGSGKLPPNFMRDFGSNATTSMASKDEELCHIPYRSIAGDFGPSFYQGEANESSIYADKQRETAWLMPIERKIRVAESAIRTYFYVSKLAKVMYVQLKQVGEDRLVLGQGRKYFETWPRSFGVGCHDRHC